ncbi:PaaI family thioesterase [Mycobacterium heckeshornense]|uniref:Phenylacetic acid degradation protein n=1 Tax=Mycobacterium heckeshornense TaxID=110505 RepID=A0A2G8BD76_9MYCO|nr:PaaI family thioesterase [Mycobacterium heckeshornense]HZQ32140.1 PaaI family thioesterase [Mycobacterium sp.]KMV23098.1 phenylacetic acid degradation protein [Mycobacterium heckeshornense]MCV7036080.1 PaaI family thioesterase [Mycobacterium heckeshornense]PIJ35711.1 PaaI family thioesterase [Mycobacterium heckeshornense]BCO35863.1 phenylacetic acid degradation protein [Mycobacterium heckeshornense]
MRVTIPGHLFGHLPFYDVLDTDDTVVLDLHNRADLVNIRGALQGGLVATLVDVAGGRLAIKHVAAGATAGTADMSIHFLAPIVEGPARATATVVRAGKRLIVVAVDVVDLTADRLAARATLTFAVMEPRDGGQPATVP